MRPIAPVTTAARFSISPVVLITGAGVVLAVLAAAGIVYAFAIKELGYFFFDGSDIPLYFRYAEQLQAGARPYTTVPLEYPPLAIPLFTLPYVDARLGAYAQRFALLMVVLAVIAGGVTAAAAERVHGSRRAYETAGIFALAMVAIGALLGNRYDAAVALTFAVFALLLVSENLAGAAFVLGLGFALKLTPALLGPLVALLCKDRRQLVVIAAAFAGGALLGFVPYLPESAGALSSVLAYHGERPLQIESVLGTPIQLGGVLGLWEVRTRSAFGSENLAGPIADGLASASRYLQPLVLAAIYFLLWRHRASLLKSPQQRVVATLALLLAFLVTGKVLSPQFLIWLLPLVALDFPSRRPLGILLLVTMTITQVMFPGQYLALVRLEPWPVTLLVVRNLLLTAAFVVALRPLIAPAQVMVARTGPR